MDESQDLRASVRRELSLEAPTRRPRRAALLGAAALAVLLWSLGDSSVSAQAPYRQELVPGFSSFDVGARSSPELVDLDGDGDLDAVVGETNGTLEYFENTGSSSAPTFVQRAGTANPLDGLDVGSTSSPELVDLDGDSDLDAVVGALFGRLQYFENTGTSAVPVFLERTGAANPFDGIDIGNDSSPEMVDLDGDGDLDAVVGESYGGLRYFENTGSSSAPAFLERSGTANPFDGIDIGYDSSPEMVDLDGDGDLDAVVGASAGSLPYFENTGSSSAPAFLERTGTTNPFTGIDVGSESSPDLMDLDGDGDFDAIVGERYGSVLYFENTGTSTVPSFLERIGTANPFDGIDVGVFSNPDLVDLDGDGDFDAIVGEFDGSVLYFENTGTSIAPAFLERTGAESPFDSIDVGTNSNPDSVDLDSDGDFDVIVGEFSGRLLYFENIGNSSAPAFFERVGTESPFDSIDVGFRCSPRLVDLDGDGDFDAIVGESGGRIVFFRSLASIIFADGFESGDISAWSATVP